MSFCIRHFRLFSALIASVLSPLALTAQDILAPLGGEYRVSGLVSGNQVKPDLAINRFGGYAVWQDDAADGQGTSICAQKLNANLSGSLSPICVNSQAAGNQENPKVDMLNDGGAVIVWQGGVDSNQDIFVRILKSDGTFAGPEFQINQYTDQIQSSPDVAVLAGGTIVVVWESFDQDGHLRAVICRMLASDGSFLGDEFQVNQSVQYNQRSVSVTALPGGGFVIAWISERSLGGDIFGGVQVTADVMLRKFSSTGASLGNELKGNTSNHLCSGPSVVSHADDGFTVAWGQKDVAQPANGWDIYAAGFTSLGLRLGADSIINTNRYGDQHSPRLAAHDGTLFVVWSSMGQDGSYDGVYGRVLGKSGQAFDTELRINTTTFNRQIFPVVASDVSGRFLTLWSSYTDGGSFFDLYAQRLATTQPLPIMPAPFVHALSQSTLAVSWSPLDGFDVAQYRVHVNGGNTASASTNGNYLVLGGLMPGQTYSIAVGYTLDDGREGNLSAAVSATTWGSDNNFDGLPDDWQEQHWPGGSGSWADRMLDSDQDGASNLSEFLAGTDPRDSASALRAQIELRGGNVWLNWGTVPGFVYQIQKANSGMSWVDFGIARFAPDESDSVIVGGDESSLFRIVRIR